MQQCLNDFLLRQRPCLSIQESGPIIPAGKTSLEGAIEAVLAMQQTTLCIQGPPGTGKSYTASQMILALIQQGKRVGITSNSHKAIHNLLEKVAHTAQVQEFALQAVKQGNEADPRLTAYESIHIVKSARDIPFESTHVIAGTAWLFSRDELVEQLDYLFIDEAGQVCLANLVAMARATQNIVLMGDQMQLDQPTQGSHPGESGLSILSYYLQGKATIPEDMGIFLGTTWRLHPQICEFISQTVYEGRLHSMSERTQHQRVLLPTKPTRWVQKEAGILYIPVDHEGNQQSCDEEVEVIREVIQELLGRTYQDGIHPDRPITLNDILIVTPYNLQVRFLQEALGNDARVASVDKFQGQEAPVVIVSMCASDANETLRGLDFLLSKNRLKVAISRAQSLAIIVGSPKLGMTKAQQLEQIALINLYCRLIQLESPVMAG
jgi:uncharacterized protein